jgi:ABC-type multidrug transport system fused ATPase/permease subunit
MSIQDNTSSREALRLLRAGLLLMTARERRIALGLALSVLAVGILDMIALASVMPFIGLLIDPETLNRNTLLARFSWIVSDLTPETLVLVVGLTGLTLVASSGVLGWALQRRFNSFTGECQKRLAQDLLGELVRAPYAWFLSSNSNIISHVFQRDVYAWARELVLKSLSVFRDLVMILLPVLLTVLVVPLAGLATILAVGVGTVLLLRTTKPHIFALSVKSKQAQSQAHLLANQALAGVKDVKLSGREEYFVGEFTKSYGSYAWCQSKTTDWHQIPTTFIQLASQLALFIIALLLWWSDTDRATLTSQLALLVLVTSRVMPAASRLSSSTTVFFGILPAVRDILALRQALINQGQDQSLNRKSVARALPWNLIELNSVCFSFPESQTLVLDHLTLKIEAGQAYGVVGPSGAGKSTMVDIVAGLLFPTSGTILIDGKSLDTASSRAWQRTIGYVAQSPFLIDATISENIAFGVPANQVDTARLEQAIEAADLTDLIRSLPEGLETPLGERGLRLSGGQRQRITIARALYDDVSLLILDEATSSLDNMSEHSFQEAVARLRGRVTTITIAHRLTTIRNCDRIFVLEAGSLVSSGTYAELLERSSLFQSMVRATLETVAPS